MGWRHPGPGHSAQSHPRPRHPAWRQPGPDCPAWRLGEPAKVALVIGAVLATGLAPPSVLAAQRPATDQRMTGPTAPLTRAQKDDVERRGTTADPRLLSSIDWYTGVTGQVDDDRARRLLLEVAAEPDRPLAHMWVSRAYSRGRMGFERDPDRAQADAAGVVATIRMLAAGGDREAAFLMGTAYAEGLGVPVDEVEALRWYHRAAAMGHVLATHNIGNASRDGLGVEADPSAAARWWLRAARAGDVIPQLRLGEAFEQGHGVRADLDVARFWYARAAAAGNEAAAEALERLGG